MAIRVEFHNVIGGGEHIFWLDQVPGVGEQVYLSDGAEPQRVAHLVWDMTHVDSPSAHINQVRADVYLEPPW